MMNQTAGHPEFDRRILGSLRALAHRLKRRVMIEGACALAAIALVVAFTQFALDRLLDLGLGPRIALLAVVLGLIGYHIRKRLLRPAGVKVGVDDVAAILERKNPGLRDELISAVSFATTTNVHPGRNSPELVASLMERAEQTFAGIKTGDALRHDRHRRFVLLGLGALLVGAFAIWWSPDTAAAYFARNVLLQDVSWPMRFRISLDGFKNGVRHHPLGDELTVVATVEADAAGDVPAGLSVEFESEEGESVERQMDRRGVNQFVLNYGALATRMRLRLLAERVGVDERTEWYRIEAVERPSVRQATIQVTPPDYAGTPAYTVPAGQTAADVLRGSMIQIEATLRKPVTQARLVSAGEQVAEAMLVEPDKVVTRFTPVRSGSYSFDLVDAGGLADLNPLVYSLRVVPDTPPKVRLALIGCGEMILPDANLQVSVEGEDNLGLASLELRHTVRHPAAGDAATTQPADEDGDGVPGFEPKQTRYGRTYKWPLQPLALTPGVSLSLMIRGRDFQPAVDIAPAPTSTPATDPSESAKSHEVGIGESSAYLLRVVTREELLADLGRREQEWRREFEQVIKSQEQLNSRVMDLHDKATKGGETPDLLVRYGQEARTQRQQVNRLRTVQGQFEQILAELETNQLDSPQVRRRLGTGVIAALGRLITTDVVEAADLGDRLRRRFDAGMADDLERRQTRIVQSMYAILANMLKWEGYNEAVTLLQDIVRLQGDLNKQTQSRMEQEIERLFGGDAPASQPTSRPEHQP